MSNKIEVQRRRYDVTISLYNVTGSLVAILRNQLLSLVPSNVDFSFTPSERTDDYTEDSASDVRDVEEPTEPGFYKYSGGAQSLLFLLDIHGQWWVWADNADVSKCEWGYIEQALGVWNLVKV